MKVVIVHRCENYIWSESENPFIVLSILDINTIEYFKSFQFS